MLTADYSAHVADICSCTCAVNLEAGETSRNLLDRSLMPPNCAPHQALPLKPAIMQHAITCAHSRQPSIKGNSGCHGWPSACGSPCRCLGPGPGLGWQSPRGGADSPIMISYLTRTSCSSSKQPERRDHFWRHGPISFGPDLYMRTLAQTVTMAVKVGWSISCQCLGQDPG